MKKHCLKYTHEPIKKVTFALKKIANFLFKKQMVISRIRFNLFGAVMLSIGAIIGSYVTVTKILIPFAFASDSTQSWNFSTSGDYTLSDTSLAEVAGSSAKLKVQNYSDAANTAALFHFDESSGNPTDSSSNANAATASNLTFATGNFNNAADFNGSTSSVSVADSASLSLSSSNTVEAWTKFDSSFSAGSHSQRQGVVDKGQYQLYYDNETGKLTYELANSSATSWTQVAGNDVNGSWDLDGQLAAHAMTSVGTDLYVGLGNATGDAEVWRRSGSTWTKVGGDGLNSGWASLTFESVLSLASDGTDVYAGLGITAGDAEVWKYDVSEGTWSKIGGDAVNSSWAVNTYEGVYSLVWQGSTLYAGLGLTANDAEVWSWNGSAWTKIGGDSTNSGWTTNFEYAYSMVHDGTYLYAALGATAGDAEIWRWNGTAWTRIGGDAINSSWADATYEFGLSMTYVGGILYAGLGTTANEAEVWSWNGSAWTQVGGDSLNSGWTTNYEGVYTLKNDGTDVYAGLGASGGDNEVWKLTVGTTTWSKIGGDGTNSSFTSTTHTIVDTMHFIGTTLYAGITSGNAGRTGEVWSFASGSWTQIGGDYINSSWGFRGLQAANVMTVSGSYLYAGTGTTGSAGNALVWRYDGSTWTLIGGQGINSSWTANTYEDVLSMISHNGTLYVGLGSSANEAEVWSWNGSAWTQIGGDNLNSGWTTNYEEVNTLATDGTYLYAGLGLSANDAEVWRWNGTIWGKIGGDSTNSGWTTGFDRITSMAMYAGQLYVGLGLTAGEAEVWTWNGSIWAKIGGDTVGSSWDSSNFEHVDSMIPLNGVLYAGLGTGTGDAEVWSYNGSTWTQIGGDDLNSGWTSGTYERVRTLVAYNGDLYAGIGNGTGEGEVWRYRSGTWSQIGGDSLNSGWDNIVEEVQSFSVYQGKLYAGLGNTQNVDAAIWSYGNNAYMQSSTASQNTSWHHVAATYNGSTMKIFIDGVQDNSTSASVTIPDTAHSLLLGTTYASRESGKAQGYFQGLIDELRLSDTARTTFTTSPYTAAAQTVQPTAAVFTSGVENFDDFTVSETTNGGSINYRLSIDGGTTWKYYSGGTWTTSASTAQVNDASTIDTNISTLTAGSGGILWQAVLDGDGTQQVTLNSVSIGAVHDSTVPVAPDTLTSLSALAGSAITTNTWYTHSGPYFSWSGATDTDGSGIWGYYVYFGTDNTADPQTAGNFQVASTFTASSLSSGSTYYLRIRARDNAQNVSSIWSAFTYKFDSTAPTNPASITISPAGYSATNDFTFSWPAGTDGSSGIAGYQYKTATASGSLSDWSSTTASTSINIPNAAYQTDANTFYLRTIDTSGNISSETTATYYFGGEGPSLPQFLAVTPSSSTTNSFAFSWDPPITFSGDEDELTYCYTVNTLPTLNSCTFTSEGATSLSASSFATQVGLNTFYLVAKNPATAGGSINYGSYTSVTFTADTSAPGIPQNLDIGDISIKSSETWRLALSWNAPSDTGSGISSYKIHRSTDDSTYSLISSTTGLSYVDTDLEEEEYYYKIKACDSVDNCGAFSSSVSLVPTGKYTEAAGLSSGPTVSAITTKKAVISWVTDRDSDSKIAYGTTSGSYFTSEPSNSTQTDDHSITLSELTPGTTYYYKAKWTDEDGNTGISSEKTFATDSAPTVTDPKLKRAGLTDVDLEFKLKGSSKVKVYYGITTAFGGVKELATSTSESTYTLNIDTLLYGTKYFYKINGFDNEDNEYEGSTLSFETLPRPKIANVRIQEVRGTAQTTALITWTTNTETSSIVTYYPSDDAGAARDEVNVTLVKQHRVVLRNLLPKRDYSLVVKGRDKSGNEAASEPQKFTTATDTRPPQIQDMRVEGSTQAVRGGSSQEQTAQLVVSWNTDENSTSQVEFGEGTGTTYSQKSQEDTNLTTNHVIVISGLTPSRVYHLRALSKDSVGNAGSSVDTVTITPKASDSALDLVITNLQGIFGFINAPR